MYTHIDIHSYEYLVLALIYHDHILKGQTLSIQIAKLKIKYMISVKNTITLISFFLDQYPLGIAAHNKALLYTYVKKCQSRKVDFVDKTTITKLESFSTSHHVMKTLI